MSPHERLISRAREARKTVYVVSGLYMAVGLVLCVYAGFAGQVLVALVGLVIVSLSFSLAVLLSTTLRLSVRVSEIAERMARIDRALESPRERHPRHSAAASVEENLVNLSSIGGGNPAELAAAVLDKGTFPRLVRQAEPGATRQASVPSPPATSPKSVAAREGKPREDEPATDLPIEELMKQWEQVLDSGDTQACRAIASALVNHGDSETAAFLQHRLEGNDGLTRRRLKETFAASVRERDYAGALAVGEAICQIFPDSRLARDFDNIRPVLEKHLARGQSAGRRPTVLHT